MADPSNAAESPAPEAKPGQKENVNPGVTTPSATATTPVPASSPAPSTGSRTSSPQVAAGHATARSSSQSSARRAPYVPQFSAATQMILKRMRGETGGLGSALATAAAPGAAAAAARLSFPQATYESMRERITANLGGGGGGSSSSRSSLSMMPAPSSPSMGTTTTPTPTNSTTLPLPLSSSPRPRATASPSSTIRLAAAAAPDQKTKRKRGKDDDGGGRSGASSPAEASDYGEGIRKSALKPVVSASGSASAAGTPTTMTTTTTTTTPTMTKSGRHVLKPDTYDPAAEDNARRRSRLGATAARTAEQALCKRCTRMHSPATNQMVFCDGCNDPWHQRCHEPWIEDDVVRDPSAEWYCAACAAKRERAQPRKKVVVVEQPRFGSWAGKPAVQKRAYLSGLSQPDLVNLLLHATELHPDLPIFPIEATPRKSVAAATAATATGTTITAAATTGGATMPRSLFAGTSTEGLFSRGDANPTAPINFIRKIPANAKKSTMAKARSGPGSLQSKADAQQAQAARSSSGHQLLNEDEDSSFTKLWPRPGKGMYSRLAPEADDDRQLVDGSDYDAFSVIVFNEKGKKIEENGVKA